MTYTLTRPCHPWTNGRIERLFRTFKETVRGHFWLVASVAEWTSICRDFRVVYNDHRPHQAYGGRTPSEVHRGIEPATWTGETITFFAGRMGWWRFG